MKPRNDMAQEQLGKTVLRRFEELGLPPSLIELGEFREHFFVHHWVMFVRDRDKVADVHLVQLRPGEKPCRRR
jgi:hypothetical protein